ncbi:MULTISPECIES: DUF2861 family protein [unclassified Vibrio]|uniref:DUF2861 family protein n=1 Tax=Vibrio sp. HB236076 TaxID=3232307 RepID=A0AB39HF56_9VIBR|nr:DUF2861 family protein [Vibrio sp. HB161653]MDP5252973.1 DUF2861 family protein [Vibrio sp. HB161653]
MKVTPILISLLSLQPLMAGADSQWFESNTPLTQAHQYLLEDDLSDMFNSMVEVWQSNDDGSLNHHLNQLLNQSLVEDCGKSLMNGAMPEWLDAVTIQRETVQYPGNDSHRLLIDVLSHQKVNSIRFEKWVNTQISTDGTLFTLDDDEENEQHVQQRYTLSNKLAPGLYRLTISADDQPEWSSWVILSDQEPTHYVRWSSNDTWQVEKKTLTNRYCPLPLLKVTVSDYVDDDYQQVWSKTYDAQYPTKLEATKLPNDRYVLFVSMSNRRWQGDILLQTSQTISRTLDVSND